MKNRTRQEIEEFAKTIWPNTEKLEVIVDKEGVKLTVANMYEAPGLSFWMLKKLADFFETDDINDDDRFHTSGCETCDYGSEYGFTLTIR